MVLNTFPLSRTPLPKALSRLKARPLSHSVAFSAFTHTSQSRCKRYVQSSSGKLCFNVGILGTVEVIFHDPNVLLLAMITIIFSPVISVVWFAFPCKIVSQVRDVGGFNIERRKCISDKFLIVFQRKSFAKTLLRTTRFASLVLYARTADKLNSSISCFDFVFSSVLNPFIVWHWPEVNKR